MCAEIVVDPHKFLHTKTLALRPLPIDALPLAYFERCNWIINRDIFHIRHDYRAPEKILTRRHVRPRTPTTYVKNRDQRDRTSHRAAMLN